MLEKHQQRFGFDIDEVDIETDQALHDRYFLEIPVIDADGELIAKAPLSEKGLRNALEDAFR